MENKRLYTIYIKNWKDPISGIIESSSNYWVLIKGYLMITYWMGLHLFKNVI